MSQMAAWAAPAGAPLSDLESELRTTIIDLSGPLQEPPELASECHCHWQSLASNEPR